MDKKTRIKRGETVLAMEHMARCINDEDIFWSWLSVGVADGDITKDTTPESEDLDYYCEDDNYAELLTLFNRLMSRAWLSGGLYDGQISGMDKEEWNNYIAS